MGCCSSTSERRVGPALSAVIIAGIAGILSTFGSIAASAAPGIPAGQDTSRPPTVTPDTARSGMNIDAVYDRPLSRIGDLPVAIGGYVEANLEYMGTDGVTEGLSFHMRRVNIFISSSIRDRISFISEIEFEEGTEEIAVETALLDVELAQSLVVRGGILLTPIGAFNQNHDGPKWEFVDRPVSATELLPATFSNVGFGVHGKLFDGPRSYAYEFYLTNGFDERIISNEENRTSLPSSKDNPERFAESPNGVPLVNAKAAFRERGIGEVGISYMGGVYNVFEEDGIPIDERRRTDAVALDFTATLPWTGTTITGEAALVAVDVPETYSQQYGDRQWGGFIDIVHPLTRAPIFGFDGSVVNAALRLEYVDWNAGTFTETGGDIGDEFAAVVPSLGWRPSSQTVIRLNYRFEWRTDLLGNPPAKSGGIQFGFASYF